MGSVVVGAAVSLDGFIADVHDDPGPIFDWYGNGDVAIAPGDPERTFHVSAATADYLERTWSTIGALVIGRRLFDITDGWQGRPSAGNHVFVVTHAAPTNWNYPGAQFTFVTTGVADAIAQARQFSGDLNVAVNAGDIGGQALALGLVDEIEMHLAPAVLGRGVRFFGDYDGSQLLLDDPEIVQGTSVTHLRYRLRS